MSVLVETAGPSPEMGASAVLSQELVPGERLVSATALSALRQYSAETRDPRAYEHPLRVASLLHDFVSHELADSPYGVADSVYDAAALHDVAQRATADGLKRDVARQTLRDYAANAGTKGYGRFSTWHYVSTLLADMDKIEDCSQHGRRIDTRDEVVNGLLRSRSDVPVPQHAWDTQSGLVDLHRIDELLERVNIESALIKSAEMLDNLQHSARKKDRATLQNVFDAESFYAPLCEAIGFDGLSMALRSEAALTRLHKGEKHEALAAAGSTLAMLGDSEQVQADVAGLFQHLLDSEAIVETRLLDESGHGIMHGYSVLHAPEVTGEDIAWAPWRVKTLGSLALKGEAADVLGLTIVVKDTAMLATAFKGIVERIEANRVVKARPAPSRRQAYSVQGDGRYVTAITRPLVEDGPLDRVRIHRAYKHNGHRVAKATFLYLPHVVVPDRPEVAIPVELQLQTEADWIESHWGQAAHLLYKARAMGGDVDVEVLGDIYNRRSHINTATLNPRSLDRGKEFRMLVAA